VGRPSLFPVVHSEPKMAAAAGIHAAAVASVSGGRRRGSETWTAQTSGGVTGFSAHGAPHAAMRRETAGRRRRGSRAARDRRWPDRPARRGGRAAPR